MCTVSNMLHYTVNGIKLLQFRKTSDTDINSQFQQWLATQQWTV